MKIYSVGGAVRDQLLGLPVKDHDWVVVGAAPEDMEKLGYRPVGRDFPVFLHPHTQEEYALARTERKVARGYKGFTVHAAPDVTLEQDLARRDLTINAMARDEQGRLIDPHGGERDLRAGLLRHVSEAFVEDPVRILRVARFAARFDFEVAPETLALMRRMVAGGEAQALVPERVWQEFSRGLLEPHPARMFEVLAACGLLAPLLPELELDFGDGAAPAGLSARRLAGALRHAARQGKPLEVRFALLAFALREPGEPAARALSARLRADNDCRDALLLAATQGRTARALDAQTAPQTVLALLEAADAFRRPERLRLLMSACESAEHGEADASGESDDRAKRPYAPALLAEAMREAAACVDAAAIAREASGQGGADIGARVREARLAAVSAALAAWRS